MMYKTISVVIVVEADWISMLPYTLYSIGRQGYPLDLIEVILVTTEEDSEAVQAVAARFTHIQITIITDSVSHVHTPSFRKRLGWQAARHELFVGLDADCLLPMYAFSHLTTILTTYPGFVVFGNQRRQLRLQDLKNDLGETFKGLGINEFLNASASGRPVLDTVYARHPWTCASFFFAVERERLTSADFVTTYDGAWGGEDNDLTVSLYKRGVHPISQSDLDVLHWDHASQSDDLYDAQLALAQRRHPEPYIITTDQALLYSHPRLPNLQAERPKKSAYTVHMQLQPYSQVISSAVVFSSLFLAMRTRARADGRPLPTISRMPEIEPLLPYPYLEPERSDSQCDDPAAVSVQLWGLLYGNVHDLPPRGKYNIGYLALEGEVIDQGYMGYLQLFDAIWVPSERNAQTLRVNGWRKPLGVIPHGVFSGYFFPHRFRPERAAEFQFITVGTGSRKQTYELIDRFAATFTPDERVGLSVCDSFHTEDITQYVRHYWPDWERLITSGARDHSYASISHEFCAADAFVTASRGEAWQIPLIEAMACGMPVIVPQGNGAPFINETNAIVYASTPVRANAPYGYVEPDLDDLMRAMRYVVSDPRPVQLRAQQLLPVVHTQYSWFMAARLAWQWLDAVIPYRE